MRNWLSAGTFLVCTSASAGISPGVVVADISDPTTYWSDVELVFGGPDLLIAVGMAGPAPTKPLTVLRSTDRGRTWTTQTLGFQARNFSLAAVSPERIDLAWENPGRDASYSRSVDGGVTWGTPLPIPGVGPDPLIALSPSGHVAIFSNYAVSVSTDAGSSWGAVRPLDWGGSQRGHPSLAWIDDDHLLVCWRQDDAVVCQRSSDRGDTLESVTIAASTATPTVLSTAFVVRGANDVVLAFSSTAALWSVRSIDGGASWLPPIPIEALFASDSLSLAAHSTGELWLTAAPLDVGTGDWAANNTLGLWSSADAATWRPVPPPIDLQGCRPVVRPAVLAPEWRQPLIYDDQLTWRASVLTGWDLPATVVPAGDPVRDLQAAKSAGTSGRLFALWSDPTTQPGSVQASTSLDDGGSWSPATVVNDTPLALRRRQRRAFAWFAESPRLTALTATLDGGAIAGWLGQSTDACAEVRVGRSSDGERFDPSVQLGTSSHGGISLAEDGAGNLVATWVDTDLVAARTIDGGRSWSAATVVEPTPASAENILVSALARTADGSLVQVVLHEETSDPLGASEWLAVRSDDGGLSWAKTSLSTIGVQLEGYELLTTPKLAAAGPTLIARIQVGDLWCHTSWTNCLITLSVESTDSGRTWSPVTASVYTNHERVVSGDESSAVYFVGDASGKSLQSGTPASAIEHADLAFSGEEPAMLVALGRSTIGILYPDWENSTPPRLYFARGPCDAVSFEPVASWMAVCASQPLDLHVRANPATGVTYQWHRDHTPIPGATTPDYHIGAAAATDAGVYTCAATSTCAIESPPTRVYITTDPAPGNVGNTMVLTAANSDTLRISWQPSGDAESYEVHTGNRPDELLLDFSDISGITLDLSMPADDIMFFRVGGRNRRCGLGPL